MRNAAGKEKTVRTAPGEANPVQEGLPLEFTVPEEEAGMRLDAALAFALPDMGLRGRRRLLRRCRVWVNGRPCAAGHTVEAGDAVRLVPVAGDAGPAAGKNGKERPGEGGDNPELRESAGSGPYAEDCLARLVALDAEFAALYKPAGLHTTALAGGAGSSLEGMLATAWPVFVDRHCVTERQGCSALLPKPATGPLRAGTAEAGRRGTGPPAELPPVPRLLTRLDYGTSGLVLGALTPEAAERFRTFEVAGRVEKTYFALVRGSLEKPLCLTGALRTDNRRKSLVLDAPHPDPARHTHVWPLRRGSFPGFDEPCTLVRVRIGRGARHQIRAHLAAAGFSLYGDGLYGTEGSPELKGFYLHHAAVTFPGFSASVPSPWDFWTGKEDEEEAVEQEGGLPVLRVGASGF